MGFVPFLLLVVYRMCIFFFFFSSRLILGRDLFGGKRRGQLGQERCGLSHMGSAVTAHFDFLLLVPPSSFCLSQASGTEEGVSHHTQPSRASAPHLEAQLEDGLEPARLEFTALALPLSQA